MSLASEEKGHAISKEDLIKVVVTQDAPKRVIAFVQELFLEKYILSRSKPGVEFALGWCYTKSKNDGWARHSYRILSEKEELSEIDHEIARVFTSVDNHRVFSVCCRVMKMNSHGIEVSVSRDEFRSQGFHHDLESADFPVSASFPIPIDDRKVPDEVSAVLPYLRQCSKEELMKLFITRAVMNCFLKNPIDIDAIYLTPRGTWSFLEYKRKDTMGGFLRFVGSRRLNPVSAYMLQSQLRKLMEAAATEDCRLIEKDRVYRLLGRVIRGDKNWRQIIKQEWTNGDAFGLDVSHVENVRYSNSIGFRYTYMVWDRPSEGGINSMISSHFEPVGNFDLRVADLTYPIFLGINLTFSDDSGSFTKDARLQFCISPDEFRSASHVLALSPYDKLEHLSRQCLNGN